MKLVFSEKIQPEFLEIVRPFLRNRVFLRLAGYRHHRGYSRLEHSFNVSYIAWKMARDVGCDERLCAVAGMLHDFCVYDFKDKIPEGEIHQAFFHPKAAAWTSEEVFGIGGRVRGIILTHMFPMGPMPSSREGWIVVGADKICATLEMLNMPFFSSRHPGVTILMQ